MISTMIIITGDYITGKTISNRHGYVIQIYQYDLFCLGGLSGHTHTTTTIMIKTMNNHHHYVNNDDGNNDNEDVIKYHCLISKTDLMLPQSLKIIWTNIYLFHISYS